MSEGRYAVLIGSSRFPLDLKLQGLRFYIEGLYGYSGEAPMGAPKPPELQGIVDEYNRKAKDIIDSMGR